jgi:hypothetical protein
MTDTTPPSSDTTPDSIPHPADILLNLIVTFLAPLFLSVSNGDINHARFAAFETVNAYRAQTQSDLITIAQIIGFGLAALDSLSLSMQDNLSPSMVLRLRANANACSRSAEQNRRALNDRPAATAAPLPDQDNTAEEAVILAHVAATQQRTAAAQATRQATQPQPATPPAPPPITDQQRQEMWAAAAARVASEYTTGLADLPHAQRRTATLKAAMLSSCANDLLNGPPITRLNPGDLATVGWPATT